MASSQTSLSVEHAACEHGRLRRPGRFFAVSAPFAFPKGRQKAQKLQKRIVQRQSLCTNATFEKPCVSLTLSLTVSDTRSKRLSCYRLILSFTLHGFYHEENPSSFSPYSVGSGIPASSKASFLSKQVPQVPQCLSPPL